MKAKKSKKTTKRRVKLEWIFGDLLCDILNAKTDAQAKKAFAAMAKFQDTHTRIITGTKWVSNKELL
jgi:hypothetical protein